MRARARTHTHTHTHTQTQERPFEIQTRTYWNLTGSNMTFPAPVLSPSSILPPLLSHCLSIPGKKQIRCPRAKCYLFLIFKRRVVAKFGNVKL